MQRQAALYFGCRNQNDFIYQQPFKKWLTQGVLTDLKVAFSRLEEHPKTYVQNMMQQNPQEVWQMLSHPQCHYYVYGDAKMADNVFETLLAIAKSEGNLSHPQAIAFFDKMKQEKRFYSDVWGVTLNFKQAIKEVQHDNYSKAEKWLEQVKQ